MGNVPRAEVLFACGVHPRWPGESLTAAEGDCLWQTLRDLMTRAVEEGRILTVPVARPPDASSPTGPWSGLSGLTNWVRVCPSPPPGEEANGQGEAHTMDNNEFSAMELDAQHAAELPRRDLLIGVTLLGLPLAGVSDVSVNVDTRGPGWLIG